MNNDIVQIFFIFCLQKSLRAVEERARQDIVKVNEEKDGLVRKRNIKTTYKHNVNSSCSVFN